ncbi:hypothetical protein VTN02DRAFT_1880 [Thermoascus thermophilus]
MMGPTRPSMEDHYVERASHKREEKTDVMLHCVRLRGMCGGIGKAVKRTGIASDEDDGTEDDGLFRSSWLRRMARGLTLCDRPRPENISRLKDQRHTVHQH